MATVATAERTAAKACAAALDALTAAEEKLALAAEQIEKARVACEWLPNGFVGARSAQSHVESVLADLRRLRLYEMSTIVSVAEGQVR